MGTEHRPAAVVLLRDAAVTLVALVLAVAAFDDIATDSATSFTVEYAFLIACAGWLAGLAIRLIRHGHPVPGSISLLALAGAVWAQPAIGPGTVPSLDPHYLALMSAFAWFTMLSLALLALGWHRRPNRHAHTV
jgi:hypothetical protein